MRFRIILAIATTVITSFALGYTLSYFTHDFIAVIVFGVLSFTLGWRAGIYVCKEMVRR